MYRGRPPPREGYMPPFDGRGPLRPPRPYPAPDYRDDRSRPRPPFHHGHHGHPDSYRRSPLRRRYPSPGTGSHRGGEYWAGGPPRERSLSPRGTIPLDHNLVITVGNELTTPPGPATLHHHDRDFPPRPEYERSRSQSQSWDQGLDWNRSRSLRSTQSRSPDRSRNKSRGRSKSRHSSRSRSRSRSRRRSRGRSFSKAGSSGCGKSRHPSHSMSNTSSSSSDGGDEKSRREFKELETARRRKELEEMLSLPTKSILKKRNDCDDSSIRSGDSPRVLDTSNMSRMADQLLQAVRGMEPHMVASVLSELRSDPQMSHRPGLDAEITEILNLLRGAGSGTKAQMKAIDDIDDEEKFLYGDCEEPKPPPVLEPVRHHALDLYGDVTEEALYGDCPAKPAAGQTHGLPVASPRLQALPSVVEADARYASHPTVGPDHDIEVQVANPAYPPGTEPLEESERQALEEYEKIQDLLKTIGLDLGVAEITKMAARTKERLHGNKLPQKMSTHLRHYSSGSSDGSRGERRGRNHSGSSSSSSSRSHSWGRRQGDSRGGSRAGSWSSDEEHRKPILPKLHKDLNLKAAKPNCSDALHPLPPPPLPPAPDTQSLPHNPGMPIPTYPPTQVHGLMPPNFPPPGYSQYGNYLPYLHQQWPPMFPPPSITLPPHTGPNEVLPPSLLHKPSYSKLASESGVKGVVKVAVPDSEVDLCSRAQKVSEEQNNESQKQKVLEEREKLRHEREVRMKKKEFLMKELERLRKQQGELLRKKRREREGHKDPLLQELSRLQEDVMAQISNLRMEHEAAEKKRSEIDKVALILGLCPSERPRRAPKSCNDQSEARHPLLQEKKKREAERSPEGRQVSGSPVLKQTSAVAARSSPDRQPISVPPVAPPQEPFEYYDAGNHWCKNCNVTSGSMFDFFTHLHSKTHRKTLDPYERPWASSPSKITKNMLPEEKLTKPAKGSEFLLPVRGFFCLLCRQFYGDAICAEEHVTTHAHNEKYKKQMYENPTYEQRRNLDRQAGLALETSGKKRKHEDEEKGGKDKESKHKKDKKDKDKKKDADGPHKDEKSKAKKEREEEEQLEKSRTAEDFKNSKSLEEERLSLSKKDDGENCKYSKTDDKYRYSKEEEERLDRYKHSRDNEYQHRYCRDVNDRCDRSKYDLKEDNDKHRYGKYSDFRSKYERDEGKPRAEREASKKPGRPPGKPEVSKPEPLPLKPYDPPKILCGPSPAMRAKLRKQSQEASKPSTVTVGPTFGKFTWKKKEDVLAKVAEKVAAEFVKEDEAAVKQQQQQVSAEDSFAKSMAVAKEIAEKLGGQHGNVPTPWVSNGANRGRIRPNLPAPAAVLRRTTMMAKPAPLNTFLSIRSQNTSSLGPPADGLSESTATAMLEAQPTLIASRLGPAEAKPAPAESSPQQIEVKPAPPATKLEPPLRSRLAAFEVQPAPLVSKPAPAPVVFSPQPFPLLGSRPVSKLAPVKAKLTPFEAKPDQSAMVKIVSDVAAPGVPESEQTHTVFVKPPPFMNINDTTQRSDRQKSNLAAAKAQQLFGIFYNSTSQSGPCSITRLATDFRPVRTAANKPPLPTQQALKTQPQPPAQSQSLPPSTLPDASISLTSSQSQTNTDIQTALVQSLQSTPGPAPEATLTTATSQRTEPKPDQIIQSQDQSVPPNEPSTSQTEPTESQTTSQICREPHSKPDQHPLSWAQSETDADAAPEAEPKLGPKTHCSKTMLTKKALPIPGPVRQTRSQTRYQTRQQQSQSEPGPASRQSADADLKDLNSSDPGSGSQLVEEVGSPGMEVTPETLGLPSDITSLDFEFNFNFE